MFDIDAYERITRGEEVNNTSPTGYINKVSADRFIVEYRTPVSGGYSYLTLKNRTERFEKVRVQINSTDTYFEVGDVVDCLGYRINLGKEKGIIYVVCLGCRKSPNQDKTLLKEPEYDEDKARTEIENLIALINDVVLAENLQNYFEKHPDFFVQKGAKGMHHAYKGGLAEHTINVAKTAMNIAETYSDIDLDVVLAGAMLHDIGKQYELQADGFTISGQMLGHISLGMMEFQKWFPAVPHKTELLHIIASHHGQLEFGSPVKPSTKEAFIVHMADLIDSRMFMIHDTELNSTPMQPTWCKGTDGYILRLNSEISSIYTTE